MRISLKFIITSAGTVVRDSIIMNNTCIQAGCELNKAIVAENVVIEDGARLGIGAFAGSTVVADFLIFFRTSLNRSIEPDISVRFCVDTAVIGGIVVICGIQADFFVYICKSLYAGRFSAIIVCENLLGRLSGKM